jgi:hypothetical protein
MSDSERASASARVPSAGELRKRGVTIGEPQRLDGAIELRPYDDAWPRLYADEAARVVSVLGHKVYADAKTDVVEAIIARSRCE